MLSRTKSRYGHAKTATLSLVQRLCEIKEAAGLPQTLALAELDSASWSIPARQAGQPLQLRNTALRADVRKLPKPTVPMLTVTGGGIDAYSYRLDHYDGKP